MAPTSASSELASLLRAQLRADAPRREEDIARVLATLGVAICLCCLAAVPVLGFVQAFRLSALVGLGTAYYLLLLLFLRRGWFHPAVPWVNVALEVSAPALLMALDAQRNGPLYAMTTPGLTIWACLVMTSALRANRTLAYAAGGLAAVEYLAVFFTLVKPGLPEDGPLTFSYGFALVRALFLFYAGVATAAVAGHVLRKSEEAFRAVREQDLMGKYLLLDRIGAGGMAEVYRATYCPEGGFEKTVAVKRVLPAYSEDADFVRLFREEARLGALLNHPNIVQVLDVGSYKGSYFLAMEHVDGVSLAYLLDHLGRALPLSAVTYLAVQLASALEYAHARAGPDGEPLGLVHRDINPPNVLVSRAGEVKLSDFGIARAASRVRLTRAGMIRGKAQYMAPEQVRMEEFDGRADLFALGLTLHEALTGRMATDGLSEEEAMRRLALEDVPAPSALRPDVSPELDAIVRGLLEREAAKRTPDGRTLRNQLERLTGDAAPFPHGQALLATAVKAAAEKRAAEKAAPVDGDAATQLNESLTKDLAPAKTRKMAG